MGEGGRKEEKKGGRENRRDWLHRDYELSPGGAQVQNLVSTKKTLTGG